MVDLSSRGRIVLEAAKLIKMLGHADLKVLRTLLKICGSLGIIVVQNEVVKMMLKSSSQCATHIRPIIATILVCMHAKCDAIAYIYMVYNLLQHNDILAWNNTLLGVGLHGNDTDAPFDVYGILKWGPLLYFTKAIQLCAAALVAISFVLTGCSTKCNTNTLSQRKSCFGISCCQSTIPYYLKSYYINITRQARDERACRSAFLVDETSYVEGTLEVDVGNHTTMKSWNCQFYKFYPQYIFPPGNPYVDDGLNASNTEDCARCKDSGGYCI
ncbi:hypothetical protein Hanom_Chr15g01397301 [Helianthus anomalus]